MTINPSGRLDSLLARLGEEVTDPQRRRAFCRKIPYFIGRVLAVVFIVYAVFLALALPMIHWIGEKNITTAFALYLPPQMWLVPPILLFPPALLFNRKLALVLAASSALFVWAYLDWEWESPPRDPESGELTLLTFNRGQQVGSLQPFKNMLQPDVIAMQEAGKRSARYLQSPEYAEFAHANDVGEFMLLSKYAITDSGLLTLHSGGEDHPVAAWFVLDFNGTPIVIYNVHLPTPREALKSYRRGAFLWGVLGIPGTPLAKKRAHYQEFWDVQMDLARQVDEHIRAETRPCLIAGDFNAPARGVNYRRFAKGREEAHEAAGSGFGFTFPGVTRNPLSLFGPWLRVDHLFAGPGWEVRACVTEKDRPSQHLAVAARFALKQR